MTTLTVNIPSSAQEKIAKLVKSLGGEVVRVAEPKELLPIEELEQGFCEVKAIREGRMPKLSLKDALRGK